MRDSTMPRFLKVLANLDDTREEAERFWTRFHGSFPPDVFNLSELYEQEYRSVPLPTSGDSPIWPGAGNALDPEERAKLRHRNLLRMRNWLREAWTIAEPERKNWKMFLLRVHFHQLTVGKEEQMEEPPPDCGMDRSLRFLLSAADRARFCANPDCLEPYFLAAQGNRKFCSPACARSGQRGYKQRWWREHAALFRRRRNKRTKE